ncbi:hypothetical protein UK23_45520 [Lentzea aerocolonigenes]|uniref:Ketosynthase family 3 (KS3) domain-containing protein n=1 Tax=Lentzea aerocolonigenes TaxID=68170 RepID=A0A0F0GBR3_LENAE|nr:type I polyketide synthase [Lentzea aerocolonigenes]KJK33583.1 hypothetical protein UK23_45520 [Lentzea aerocolonigenes]
MSERVAVVGMSIRAAGVRDTADFWRLLVSGGSGRREFDYDELARRGVPEHRYKDPAYVAAAYPMADALGFDPAAFGFGRSEAELTDPQHRVVLEACYRAVESSGAFIGALPDRVGVFLGQRTSDYGPRIDFRTDGAVDQSALSVGTSPDYLSTRVSYAYGLTGPSMTVLTACSSSNVAVHLACQAILAGECDSALAGGVSVNIRDAGYLVTEGGIYSPSGRCAPYTTSADGTVESNGVAVLFLRRLDLALAEGNPILGVVAGTAVNNDGRERAGFTAPGVAGQVELIEEALDVAELRAAAIGLLEGHGSGTGIGDALEIDAATQAFHSSGALPGECRLHSVKANVGNLTAAAGAAGVIGALLALRHGQIPPNAPLVGGARPVDVSGTPFSLADRLVEWPRSEQGRYAAISSFGLGGTNGHVIIGDAEHEVRAAERKGRSWQLLPLSADDPERLGATVRELRAAVDGSTENSLRDIGHTLRVGRPALAVRTTALVRVGDPAAVAWPDAGRHHTAPATPPTLVLLLPDEVSAGTFSLYGAEPAFRSTVDEGLTVVEQVVGQEIFAGVRDAFRLGVLPSGAEVLRPVLHLLGLGQHAFLGSVGLAPDVLVGLGTGELTAAALSGVLSPEDATRAVCRRGQGDSRPMRDLRLRAPETPMISGVTGSWLSADEARDPSYWGVQQGEPVAAEDALRTVTAAHPDAELLRLAGDHADWLRAVGGLWERGFRVDWQAYAEDDHALLTDVAPRVFGRTPYLHPALLDDCPGIDPAELTGDR